MRNLQTSSYIVSNSPREYESCIFTGNSVSSCLDSTVTFNTIRSVTTSATFTSCKWNSCGASNAHGVAIISTSSSVTISIASCLFKDCTADKNGGAVYLSGINSLSVIDTLFQNCISKGSGENVPGGGGLYMSGSTSSLTILTSTFLGCKANVASFGGGGFHALQMKSVFLSSSRILSCSTSLSGGGVYISEFTPVSYSDTLFSGNSAVFYGGAIREYKNSKTSTLHLTYLFFSCNSCKEHCGGDLSVSSELIDSPFLYSFSTSASNRFAYALDDVVSEYNDNWLPQGIDVSLIQVFRSVFF